MIEVSKATKLTSKIFGVKTSPELLAQAVRVHLGNQRSSSAKTKTRAEVNKTTAKPYKQKGTGRARHGSRAAPVFVGGGRAFGPDGTQNYKLKLSKYLTRLSLLGALTAKSEAKQVFVATGANTATGKTAQVAKVIPAKSLVIATMDQQKFIKACKNLAQVKFSYPNQLNAYSVLNNTSLIISEEALEALTKLYA
jgi:large subunit ribosomal protein L4